MHPSASRLGPWLVTLAALGACLAGGARGEVPPSASGFRETTRLALGHTPVAFAIGDLNGDGRPDVVLANADSTLTTLFGDGAGGVDSPQDYLAGSDVA